jgi:hypothetical protein
MIWLCLVFSAKRIIENGLRQQESEINMEKKPCEVNIHFRVPKDKSKHIFNARDELAKAGISFDTGGCNDGDIFCYDWEFDWSLKGGVEVNFKKFKEQ